MLYALLKHALYLIPSAGMFPAFFTMATCMHEFHNYQNQQDRCGM